jgi:iron-sulfur cluster assembly protein
VPLQLQVASQPAAQDQVVGEAGAKVFVSSKAAPMLDDKVLDVQLREDRVEFVIGSQQGQPGEPG